MVLLRQPLPLPRLICAAALLLLSLAAVAQAPGAPCEAWAARLISYQGPVSFRRAAATGQLPAAVNETFCVGDVLELGPYSRAALQLPDQTVVSLDQGTVVSFAAPQDDKRTWLDILKGVIHVISRDPRALRVITPFANAGIEGTEFLVRVGADAATVLVFEGRVRVENASGAATAGSGESVLARAGTAPVLQQVVRPRDQVVWTLYYPPTASGPLPGADAPAPAVPDAAFFVGRAEQRLATGQVTAAEADLASALALAPGSAEVLARQSVIALTRNDAPRAASLADQAVAAAPDSAAARLAQSYARQSAGDLPGAVATLEAAAAGHPGDALVQARLAELYLASGELERGEATARAAVAADPQLGLARTILGFAALTRVRLGDARAAFNEAIRLDPSAPLPRLGLGLARIRGGDLAAGRQEIETAVILDPNNSLVRSYVGKAYYEEKRDRLAASQLAIAKKLDPNDPTPWFYDAIRQLTVNQPVAALEGIRKSAELNDNRAVYRSRLRLDDDAAARSASLGRVYGTLGFDELALRSGWATVSGDPRDYSGHRLLADSYVTLPRHEIARVNELVQSQLLQPLNATAVQPQLGEANLFILDSAGPTAIGFNEFNPLFASDGLHVQASAVAGSNQTRGGDGVISGIQGQWSFSLGGFRYETDGFRTNNDLEISVGNLLVQYQLSPATSMLAEVRTNSREQGELRIRFDPQAFDNSLPRQDEDTTSLRLGLRHDLTARSTIAALLNYESGSYLATLVAPPYRSDTDLDAYSADLQYIYRREDWNLVTGARYYGARYRDTTEFLGNVSTSRSRPDARSAYAYGVFRLPYSVQLTLGMSRDESDGRNYDRKRWNPKAGVVWRPSDRTTLYLGAMSTLQRPTPSRQDIQPALEPTAVAGFNQFFFGSEAEDADRYGVRLDHAFSDSVFAGAEFTRRRLDVPFVDFTDFPPQTVLADVREDAGRAYLYWAATPRLAASIGYSYDPQDNDRRFTPNFVARVETNQVPLRLAYFHPRGPFASVTGTFARQSGLFQDTSAPPFPFVAESDQFFVADAELGFRLPRRAGMVRLEVRNLFDRNIRFQDVDPENPRIFPERVVLLKATFAR